MKNNDLSFDIKLVITIPETELQYRIISMYFESNNPVDTLLCYLQSNNNDRTSEIYQILIEYISFVILDYSLNLDRFEMIDIMNILTYINNDIKITDDGDDSIDELFNIFKSLVGLYDSNKNINDFYKLIQELIYKNKLIYFLSKCIFDATYFNISFPSFPVSISCVNSFDAAKYSIQSLALSIFL